MTKQRRRKPVRKEGRAVNIKGQKARQGRATAKTLSHPQGRSATVGTEERLMAIQERVFRLKIDGLFHKEIADIVKKEFELEELPTQGQVKAWLDQAYKACFNSLKEEVVANVHETLSRTTLLLKKWLPLATGQLAIKRHVTVEGQRIPVIDERCYSEQLQAANMCVKFMQLQARVLQPQQLEDENGNKLGKGGIAAVVMQTINNIVMPGEKPKPGTVGEVLTLELGERKTA